MAFMKQYWKHNKQMIYTCGYHYHQGVWKISEVRKASLRQKKTGNNNDTAI